METRRDYHGEKLLTFREDEYAVVRNTDNSYTVHTDAVFELLYTKVADSLEIRDIQDALLQCNNKNMLMAKKGEAQFMTYMDTYQSTQWQEMIQHAFEASRLDAFVATVPTLLPHLQTILMNVFAQEVITFITNHRTDAELHGIITGIGNKTWAILFPYLSEHSQEELCNLAQEVGVQNIVLYCSEMTRLPAAAQDSTMGQGYVEIYKWMQKTIK